MRFLSHQTLRRTVTRYQLKAALLLLSCCGLTPESLLMPNDGSPALAVADQRDLRHCLVVEAGTADAPVAACCQNHGTARSAQLLQLAASQQVARQGKWRHLNAHTNQFTAGATGLVAGTHSVRGAGSWRATQPANQAYYAQRICVGGSRLT